MDTDGVGIDRLDYDTEFIGKRILKKLANLYVEENENRIVFFEKLHDMTE